MPSEARILSLTEEMVSLYSTVRLRVLVEVSTLKVKVVSKLMVDPSVTPISVKVLVSWSSTPLKKRLC